MTDSRNISNSEVTSWLTCRRKYFFEFIMDIEPKQFSDPLTKGNIIHAMLEEYYIAKSEGLDEAEAREWAMKAFMQAASANMSMGVAELGSVKDLVIGYFDFYCGVDDEHYEIIGVEMQVVAQLTDSIGLPGTLDLVVRDRRTGLIYVWDHKSSYNFFSAEQLTLNGQFPKYVFLLRSQGMNVKGAVVNQLRTRQLKPGNELYRREAVIPTDAKVRSVIRQHIQAGTEILNFRASEPEIQDTPPLLNKMVCGSCNFAQLCDYSMEGTPLEYAVQQDFQKKQSYGYNHPAEVQL